MERYTWSALSRIPSKPCCTYQIHYSFLTSKSIIYQAQILQSFFVATKSFKAFLTSRSILAFSTTKSIIAFYATSKSIIQLFCNYQILQSFFKLPDPFKLFNYEIHHSLFLQPQNPLKLFTTSDFSTKMIQPFYSGRRNAA